ncbi:MAG: UbiA family prenyltransferase [Planctomycetes bacterium]|nr:UbiA family prenyltransferase [Planctomycetota bacterium]
MAGRVRAYLELVRFSHTIFALPFALMALFLAAERDPPGARTVLLVLACLVAARTAAMAYNRLADRDSDAANPRTRARHLPAGLVSPREVALLVLLASGAFVAAAWFLNRLAFILSFPVLALLLGYSHTKRFTAASHFVLGLALGLAPLGAWIALRGALDASWRVPALLGLAALFWVAGFDILYSCQDVDFDRGARLRSIPARFGVARALHLARLLHAAMLVALLALGREAALGAVYGAGVAACAALLAWEHSLVKPHDLSRVNVAFFTANGCVSLLLCAATLIEVLR